MARIARTQAGIARAALLSEVNVMAAVGATHKQVQTFLCSDANSDAMAACTRDAFGGRRIGTILDAMIAAQNGKCLLCSETFWSVGTGSTPEANGSVPNVMLLVPSVLWSDVEVSGTAAHESGWAPGNMIAACTLCTNDRDRASEAQGSPVCIDVDTLTEGQRSRILLTFPKGVKVSALDSDSARVAQRRAIRLGQIGF